MAASGGVGGGGGGPTGGGASTLSSTILRKTASESNLLKMKMKPKRIGALGESTRAGPYQVGGDKNHVPKMNLRNSNKFLFNISGELVLVLVSEGEEVDLVIQTFTLAEGSRPYQRRRPSQSWEPHVLQV